jgi:hypothetical protein
MDNSPAGHEVPEQHSGVHKDLKHEVTFESIEDAEDFFLLAKERLLDVNSWERTNKTINTRFRIADRHGNEINRKVHKGDLIVIDIPGPGPSSGDSKDWVQVEELAYDDYPDEDREDITLRLRPVSNPATSDTAPAHFFTSEASSSFVLERIHNKVIIHYHGRNEKPNLDAESVADKIRNTIVAVGAFLGFSDMQWDGLIKGIVEE